MIKGLLDVSFNLDFVGKLILWGIIYLLIQLMFLFFRFLWKKWHKEQKTFTKRDIVVTLSLISSVLILSIYFKSQYITKFYMEEPIETFEICWDECVKIQLTDEEKNIIEKEVRDYYFGYDEDFYMVDWIKPSSAAIIHINQQELMYQYLAFYDEEYIFLAFEKDNKYFVKEGKNKVTKILHQYITKHKDTLNKME